MRWHNGVVECRHPQASLGLRADPRRRTLNTAYAECITARAKSVIPDHRRDVCFWHLASFRCAAKFVRYWSNSGQRWILAWDCLSANDANVWSGRALQVDFAELALSGLASMYPASDWSVLCSGSSWISARVRSH